MALHNSSGGVKSNSLEKKLKHKEQNIESICVCFVIYSITTSKKVTREPIIHKR